SEGIGNELVELPGWAEQRRHLAARSPADALNRFLVERIGHREPDHAAVDFYRENIVIPAKLFGEDLRSILVDLVRIEIDVVDSERFLYELGDFVKRQDITVDQGLRDVGFLLKPPALDQFRGDTGHGPYQGNEPL